MVDQIRTLFCVLIVGILSLGTLPASSALPTPGLFGEAAYEATGRYFPEATKTNDYVGWFEAMDTLRILEEKYPGRVVIREAGESFGLNNLQTGAKDTFKLPMVEVTNPDSHVAWEDKIQILFMLSIHGNEKGGREGGLRIIEDFARGEEPEPIGMAAWTNQNGAGNGTYNDYLDYMTLLFLFPNVDGWAHDEPQYLTGTAEVDPGQTVPVNLNCGNGVVFYCRTNGNNIDLNRQSPTIGWSNDNRKPVSEPEAVGYYNFIVENYENIAGGTDIHGMLMSDHFVLTMTPAGSMDPHEMTQTTRLAEMLKERLNNDPYFDLYRDSPHVEGFWGDDVNEWGTVWDSIGYTDSGFNSDWFAQESGLNVPGFGIELAYNHITFDSQYELGMYMNALHIQSVRQIVAVFMDAFATDLQVAIDTQDTRTAVLANPVVVTNTDDDEPLGGWAAENPHDDAWDYLNNDFFAASQSYFREMKPYLKAGDVPAVFDELNQVDLTETKLAKYDNLVIPGSAFATIEADQTKIDAIKAWVETGGNLILTDSALGYLEAAGMAKAGSVDQQLLYAGFTNFYDRGHPLVSEVRGFARQTYEPVPVGFTIQSNSAPNWIVKRSAIEGLDAVGYTTEEDNVNFGQFTFGEGNVRFLGSLLPDPSEEFYHPYGLDPYATTYSGNQLLRNMLGWEQVFEAPPALLTDKGIVYKPPVQSLDADGTNGAVDENQGTPAPAVAFVLVAVALLAGVLRRRD